MPFQSILLSSPLQTPEAQLFKRQLPLTRVKFYPAIFSFYQKHSLGFLSILFGVSKYEIVGKEDFKN